MMRIIKAVRGVEDNKGVQEVMVNSLFFLV